METGSNVTRIIIPSCQFYYKTGRVFYGLNTFAFGGVEALVVFLIGVGRRNAIPRAQCAGELIVCIRTVPTFCLAQEGSTDTDRPNIWNDKTHYAHFLKTFNTDRHSRIWPKRT